MLEKDEEAIEDNIKVFRDITQNLQGCMRTSGEKFDCYECEDFNTCFKVLNESVAAISLWIADYAEAHKKFKKKFPIDKNMDVIEEREKRIDDMFS